jgi:hypothetical protein
LREYSGEQQGEGEEDLHGMRLRKV